VDDDDDDDDREREDEEPDDVTEIGRNERSTTSTNLVMRSRRKPKRDIDNESGVNDWRMADSEIIVDVGGTISKLSDVEKMCENITIPLADERIVNVGVASELENRTLRAYASFNCSCKRSLSVLYLF